MRTMLIAALVVGCGGREFETARAPEPDSVAGRWVLTDTLIEAHGTACDVPFFLTSTETLSGQSIAASAKDGPLPWPRWTVARMLTVSDGRALGRTVILFKDDAENLLCTGHYNTTGTR